MFGVFRPSNPFALLVFILRGVRRALFSRDIREQFIIILSPWFVIIAMLMDGGHVDMSFWREFTNGAMVN
jgi:hypothetical protein